MNKIPKCWSRYLLATSRKKKMRCTTPQIERRNEPKNELRVLSFSSFFLKKSCADWPLEDSHLKLRILSLILRLSFIETLPPFFIHPSHFFLTLYLLFLYTNLNYSLTVLQIFYITLINIIRWSFIFSTITLTHIEPSP